MTTKLSLALLACLVAGAVQAKEHKDLKFDPATFSEQRGRLIEAIESGEAYREISDDDQRAVIQALDRMQARLSSVQSIAQLSSDDKIAVFNDQELVNNLLTQAAADSRLVCTRGKTLGSNMRSNSCMTVAERRRRQEESQDQMRRMQRPGTLPPGG